MSITDYLLSQKKPVVIRQYIATKNSARLVVLGNQVIASYNYEVPAGDFRSNATSQPKVSPANYPTTIEEIAKKAVHAQLIEFGGVDIIFDKDNQPYVTEVNFPCNIIRAQKATNVNVASLMIKYLINKSLEHD